VERTVGYPGVRRNCPFTEFRKAGVAQPVDADRVRRGAGVAWALKGAGSSNVIDASSGKASIVGPHEKPINDVLGSSRIGETTDFGVPPLACKIDMPGDDTWVRVEWKS